VCEAPLAGPTLEDLSAALMGEVLCGRLPIGGRLFLAFYDGDEGLLSHLLAAERNVPMAGQPIWSIHDALHG
jgi:hypothetical protein